MSTTSARLVVLLGLAATIWLWTEFVARPWVVAGRSMQPVLRQGDRVLVDVWSYRFRRPRPGEVVLLRGPDGEALVKRVHGRGQTPSKEVWVEGDNAVASLDSRQFGPLPADSVLGRVSLRIWPLSRVGSVGLSN